MPDKPDDYARGEDTWDEPNHFLFSRFGRRVSNTNVVVNLNRQRDKTKINASEMTAGFGPAFSPEMVKRSQAEMNKQAIEQTRHKGRRPRLRFWQIEPKAPTLGDVKRQRHGGSSEN